MRFVDQAIDRAGLTPVREARRRGDVDAARAIIAALPNAGAELDLLVLGALADAIRSDENGAIVRVHALPESSDPQAVTWIREATNELDLLRRIAIARVTGPIASSIGVDWGKHGLELAQVSLGFGATDLIGPITRKSGLLIREDEKKKVKGLGMVDESALKRQEIAALIRNAGRSAEFTDEIATTTAVRAATTLEEVAHA